MANTSQPPTLEQVIAQVVQAGEAGKSVDTTRLLRTYPKYRAELEEFLTANAQFLAAAEAARQEMEQQADNAIAPTEMRSAVEAPQTSSLRQSLALNPPKIFGDYAILEEIDRGGMGVVYKARHVHLGRTVALKLIRSGELASDEEVQRFRSEAEAAASLTHAGIVPIYEVGLLHGLFFYTMAYIEGHSLANIVSKGVMETEMAMRIVHKLCLAVEYAHACGIYHRDLKPANVLIDKSGQPIIIDFGLAKNIHRDSSLTASGQILGTPAYMAPEQALGKASLGPSGDVYSLGAILYCLCAGQPPFNGPTPFDVLLQVLDREPPDPSKLNRRVSGELDYVCRKALQKDPTQRYQTASQLAHDLQAILQNEPLDCPRTRLVERLESWWRREPILVAHVCGIGATTAIVAASHFLRGQESTAYPYRMGLLCIWFAVSFILQYWVVRARWRDVACLSWAAVDVALYTTLIAIADQPRQLLLIGYPMLIVASSLFYRNRFVIFMTSLCIVGFLGLTILASGDDFLRLDFSAIFVSGLAVICLSLLAIIRRVRGMCLFYENTR